MPRYRVIKEIPHVLGYRDGKVFFQDYYAGGKEWVWFCRREIVHNRSVQICTAEDAIQLDKLRKNGVTVEKGSTADHVLRSLVRKGYAERLPD